MTIDRVVEQVSAHELNRRWQALRALMEPRNLDLLIFQSSNDWLGGHVRWLTGTSAYYGYPRAVLFWRDGSLTVVEHGERDGHRVPAAGEVPYRGVTQVIYSPCYASVHYTGGYEAELVAKQIRLGGGHRIGLVNPTAFYHGFGTSLAQQLRGLNVCDLTEQVDGLKAIKSAEELQFLRRTAALQDSVLAAVAMHLKPGLRDLDIAGYAGYVAHGLGAEQGVYLCSSAPQGEPALFRQKHSQGRVIQSGDVITLLVETNGPAGYYTEIARTFVLGRASSSLRDGIKRAIEAQKVTLQLLRPGARASEILPRYNTWMRIQGLPEERRLHCHGQGADLVERPLIREDETMTIEQDMCLVVHPGFISDGAFAHVCDNYVIGPQGPGSCLHETSKEVIEL